MASGQWRGGEEKRTNIKINQPQIFPPCIWSPIVLYMAMVKDSENGLCKAPCAISKLRKKESSLFRKKSKTDLYGTIYLSIFMNFERGEKQYLKKYT